ncbi:MAG: response regulator [Gammaproteobacteria bacterium]
MAKILLVEDNKKLANYIQDYLQNSGHQVNHEIRGDKAVYRILAEQPDIVILDIMLPGLDGIQVCQTVRPSFSGMILMLTALGENESQFTGLTSGADDYVIKPVDPKILAARVATLLRRKQPSHRPQHLQFGWLTLDLVQRTVRLKNEFIALKPLEFELLTFLATNADHVVNRENIMQALRGISYDGIDRTIDLRISYLRKKLHDNIAHPFKIKTIRGKGYVFISTAWDKG